MSIIGTPNYPKDMASEWQKLRRDVKNNFTSANVRKGIQVFGKGLIDIFIGLVLHPGAYLRSLYTNGNESVFIGTHEVAGQEVEGVIIRRPSGALSFWSYGTTAQDSFWSFWDRQGNIVLSDDADSGTGLARPWLTYNTVRTSTLNNPPDTTTSTTFVAHHTISGWMQHPKISAYLYVVSTTSPFTDNAQVQLRDPTSGAVIAQSGSINNNYTILEGVHPNFMFGGFFRYDLEIRRTSGSGSVGVTPLAVVGRQT